MAYAEDLNFVFLTPTKIVFGEGAANDIGSEVDSLGGKKAFIVTDENLIKVGLVAPIQKALGAKYVGVFSEVPQDSDVEVVNKGAELARQAGADTLISIGGGSVIDTAKGMAILVKEGGKLRDYEGIQVLSRPITPHIVIPTTGGTGSEVSYAAVIKDHEQGAKLLFCDYHIIPNVAILDPKLLVGLPAKLTASTGMDAMCHAVEAIHSLQREPVADALALHALRLISQYLPRCVEKPDDLVARGQQLIAATLAGAAFSNAQVGLVHAMAHTVGARHGVPHGIANSILLPYVILYNLDACADRYKLVAEALGVKTEGLSDEEAGKTGANKIWELTKRMNLPQRLRDVGVPEDDLEGCAEHSLSDGAIVYNPKPILEAREVLEVYKKAW